MASTNDDDARLSVEHMAANLYSERIKDDQALGLDGVYRANPDARALYFKGIQDTLLLVETWTRDGVAPSVLAMFIEALQKQTADTPLLHTTH